MKMSVEHWWNDNDRERGGGRDYSKKSMFHCHFFRHKPHTGFNLDRTVNALRIGYKTNQLMTYRETIVVCSDKRTKHTIALRALNVELWNGNLVATAVNHCVLQG